MTGVSGLDRRQFLGALSLGAAALAVPHIIVHRRRPGGWQAFSRLALPR